MITLINGSEIDPLILFKGGDDSVNVVLLSDRGVPLDITADVLSLDFYDTDDRRNAAVYSATCTIVTAAAGYMTAAITAAGMSFGPGTYYAFAKRNENVGGTYEYSRTPVKVIVR